MDAIVSSTAILNQALELSSTERANIAEQLLYSLGIVNPDIEDIWIKESERRYEAYQRGEIEAIPAEEVFKEISEITKR